MRDQRNEAGIEEAAPSTPHAHSPPSVAKDRLGRPLLRRIFGSFADPAFAERADIRAAKQVISICDSLLSERGEVAGARLASEIFASYQKLEPSGRDQFFELLGSRFSPDPERVAREAESYRARPSLSTLAGLQTAVEAPRQELFRRLNLARGGIRLLIEMRNHLLATLEDCPERTAIDADFLHLFRSWFNGGFLVLQRLDWRTSAVVLERLIQFEAVHQIQGWGDLRRRLEADRRCYAFFHPALPEEPLIFIEVALTRAMSARVQPLLDPNSEVLDRSQATCAIFYSITNCLKGLRGVSFGNLLIKQVVDDLSRSLPRVRTYATLSPMPGFSRWLVNYFERPPAHRTPEELVALVTSTGADHVPLDRSVMTRHKDALIRLGAYYLIEAKLGGAPVDAVARFHLANGACLQRLNWMADTSETGMRRSLGLMVNYVYRLADLERNHDAYANNYGIAASRQVKRLARQSMPASSARVLRHVSAK